MKIIKYIIIGLIQGLTEPLPISSSAHMVFINHYFKLEPMSLSFEIIINFASTLAIALFFFRDLKDLIINTFKKNKDCIYNHTYTTKLVIASIPATLVGFLCHELIDEYFLSFFSCSIFLFITGLFLCLCLFFLRKEKSFTENINYKNAVFIGTFQAIALIPGLSRSGLTLTAGLSQNIKLKNTLKFSFFLYLIASIGALVLSLFKLSNTSFDIVPTILSGVSAFVGTSISIRIFYNLLNKKLIKFFMIYCFLVSITNIIIYFTNL